MILFAAAAVFAAELPDLAADKGYDALLEHVHALVPEIKPKKLGKELEALGFSQVALPVRAVAGAELVLGKPTPLTGCAWADGGAITCAFTASVTGPVDGAAYRLRCRTRYGAAAEVKGTVAQQGDEAVFTVVNVEQCWDLNAAELRVEPVSTDDLDGIGFGDDTHAPERVELTDEEIKRRFDERRTTFKACYNTALERRPDLEGELLFEYRIGLTGKISRVDVSRDTLGDAEVVTCIQQRISTMTFPPAHQGGVTGKYALRFAPPN